MTIQITIQKRKKKPDGHRLSLLVYLWCYYAKVSVFWMPVFVVGIVWGGKEC